MGKGREWSESETIQLCRSWLEVSEDAIRGAGQKRKTFASRLYNHWLANKSEEDSEDRSEIAVNGRWKKMQPEVTKFCGVYGKLKSRERSGWNEEMYLDAAMKVYADRHKQPFEFLAAWTELKDKPKWTSKITSETTARGKRKSGEDGDVFRPEGRKAAKKSKEHSFERPNIEAVAHLRFVAAAEKKASVMEKQLQMAIFMQDPQSAESKEYFALQRKAILVELRKKTAESAGVQPEPRREDQRQQESSNADVTGRNKEQETNENTEVFQSALV